VTDLGPKKNRAARDIASDLLRLTRKASRLIDLEQVAMADLRADPTRVDQLLERLLPLIVEGIQHRSGDITSARAMASMAAEVTDLDDEWRQCRRRDAERCREHLAASLLRLRSLRTEQEIVEQICEEACRACGSERALFAWIGADGLLPFRHFRADSRGGQPRPAAAESLSGLPTERTVVERRQTARVSGGDDCRQPVVVQRFMRGSSFAIAPIVVDDGVIGLIYVAQSASLRRDENLPVRLDRFANCVSRQFELVMLLRRLDAQSAQVGQGLSTVQRVVTESDTSVDLMQLVGREQAGPTVSETDSWTAPLVTLENEFTLRERDVMKLLSTGLDNKQIAERLAIAESTVKSHLQHMLRKAGAVNRSELIGQFYAASPPSAGS
jgi:DNA-binding CsgD family transcriptional regulator